MSGFLLHLFAFIAWTGTALPFLPFAFLVKGKAIPLQAWTGLEGSGG
jgi:hypothetical protein